MCWKISFEQSAVLTNSVDRVYTTNACMHTYSQRHAYTHEYIHACMYTDLIRHQLHNWGQTKRFKDGETCVTLSDTLAPAPKHSGTLRWDNGSSCCCLTVDTTERDSVLTCWVLILCRWGKLVVFVWVRLELLSSPKTGCINSCIICVWVAL